MKKNKKGKCLYQNIPLFLLLATLFMGIGYASINSISLEIKGAVAATFQDGVFIYDVVLSTENSLEQQISEPIVEKNMLGTNISLNDDLESKVEYIVSIRNNYNYDVVYLNTTHLNSEQTYSNNNIVYTVKSIDDNNTIEANSSKNFIITFTYLNAPNTSSDDYNILKSYVSFNFAYAEWYRNCDENTDELRCQLINSDTPLSDSSLDYSVFGNTTTGLYYTNDLTKNEDTNGDGIGERVYYYRGSIENNYVIFANYCWRIVRTLENGSIRLIYAGKPSNNVCPQTGTNVNILSSTTRFNSAENSNAYVGYMYGSSTGSTYASNHANTNNSLIKSSIDSWYQTNLSSYSSYLDDFHFCSDRSLYSGTGIYRTATEYGTYGRLYYNKEPQYKCINNDDKFSVYQSNGNGKLTYPIALLTADEAAFAGSMYASSSGSNYLNTSNYLYTGKSYWLLSPSDYYTSTSSSYIWSFMEYGNMMLSKVYSASYAVRPTINIIGKTVAYSGTGEYNNPYIIEPEDISPPSSDDSWYNNCGSDDKDIKCVMLNNNISESDSSIDFSSMSNATNGEGLYYTNDLSKTEDYDGDGKGERVYYYRGNVENNYVLFANNCWRIVRTLEDGSVRLIYSGEPSNGVCPQTGTSVSINDATSAFSSSYSGNAYLGYKYGSSSGSTYAAVHAHTNDSLIKEKIDAWYESNIQSYSSYLSDYHYCVDKSLYYGTGIGSTLTQYGAYGRLYDNKNPQYKCPASQDKYSVSNGILDYPIALLTADEAYYAGYIYSTVLSTTSNYLYSNNDYWLLSPSDYDTSTSRPYVWVIESAGRCRLGPVTGSYGVRPVINIKGTISVSSGTGSYDLPYVLSNS